MSNRVFHRIDYLKITIFGFALAALWGSLHTIVIQARLLDFVAESQKTLWLGVLTLVGLLLAMIVQPIAGALSDRSSFSWGRRRPYILLGTILVILFLPGIGLSGSFSTFFIIYCLLQVASNTAQGPYQAFIPDLVPGGRRGVASGVKSLLEFVGGIALVWMILYFMEHYFTEQRGPWLWYTLALLAFFLLGAMIATVLTVKERPGAGGPRLPLLATFYKSFKIDVKASPGFILFLVSRFLILTALITMQRYALYYLMDAVGVANPVAAMRNLLIVVGIGMVVTVYPAGYLSDRIGRRPVAISSGLLGALGTLLLLFSNDYRYIMFCGVLLGISSGGFMSSNWALATDLVAKGEEARYLGLTNLATAGSGALVGLMGLAIYFLNVSIPGVGYSVMLLACFIYFIVGSLLLMKVKRR
jgi:Na+/melibiose symporter-like transporter